MENVMQNERKWERKDTYDVISIALVCISLLFAVFRFEGVFTRLLQGIRDFGLSVAFYFTELPGLELGVITPTVGEIPQGIESLLPFEWPEFVAKMETFFTLFFDKEDLSVFFDDLIYNLVNVLSYALTFAPAVILIIFLCCWAYKQPNNNKGKTGPRKAFEKLEETVYVPIRDFIKGYVEYVQLYRLVRNVLLAIWLYNLNVITLAFEVIAYLLYAAYELFNVQALYAQLVKLVYDVSVPLLFLPWWFTAIVVYRWFDKMRKNLAVASLQFFEACNKEFLKLYLGALFIVGKQRMKKTTIITDMALSQEVIYREEAFERFKNRDKQFPFFPWQELEEFYFRSQERHTLPTLASCREFIKKLRIRFEKYALYEKYPNLVNSSLLAFRKYGYTHDDFLFGYDWQKYGLTYVDGLTLISIFDAIESYLQLFYIYAAPTSLIFGNYSIRTDIRWADEGNFPLLDADFFNRNPEDMLEESQYAHVAHLDSFRIYKVVNPEDPYADGFEVGVPTFMENAKERGNQNTNQAVKASDSGANPKNDGTEMFWKIQTHNSTVENYTFCRPFMDDHRPDSMNADAKDMCDIIMIKDVSEAKLVMPFYMVENDLYTVATKIYDKIYYTLRYLRGDANDTLLVYLLKKIYNPIFQHHDRIVKQYSVYTAHLHIEDAMQKKVLTDKAKYYICQKKVYADRFATDGLKQFFHQRALRSKYGLNDFPQFKGKHIDVQEMKDTGSFFYSKIIESFHYKQARADLLREIRRRAKKAK